MIEVLGARPILARRGEKQTACLLFWRLSGFTRGKVLANILLVR